MLTILQRAFMHACFCVSALTERLRLDTLTCALEGACMHLALQHDEGIVWALVWRDEQRHGRYGETDADEPVYTKVPAPRKRKAKPVAKRRE